MLMVAALEPRGSMAGAWAGDKIPPKSPYHLLLSYLKSAIHVRFTDSELRVS